MTITKPSEEAGKGSSTTIDFIARGESPNQWLMVLVEEGPWARPIADELRRLQDRLYGAVDAALDGQLAEGFPQTLGQDIIVRVDCYELPQIEVREFFTRFSEGVFLINDYREALQRSKFVRSISFEICFEKL